MKKGFANYKRKIYIVRFVVLLFFITFLAALVFIGNGLFERGVVNLEINNFKARAVFEKEDELQGQKVTYYKVVKKYDYEDVERPIYDSKKNSKIYIGSTSDIILTSRNPLRMYGNAIVRDIAGLFARYFYLGHATINISEDGSKCVECVGNQINNNGVRIVDNDWIETEVRYGNDAQTIIGLRIKNTTEEQRKEICNNLEELVGSQYNYLLIFYSRNKYYCTDLISRVLRKSNIKINYDSFYTTGNDLIVSNSTYIIFLCERVKDGYFNIYYLSKEK